MLITSGSERVNVGSKNLVLDQLIIPKFMFLFIVITHLK